MRATHAGVDAWNLGLKRVFGRARVLNAYSAPLQVNHVRADERERSHQHFRDVVHRVLERTTDAILEQVELGVVRIQQRDAGGEVKGNRRGRVRRQQRHGVQAQRKANGRTADEELVQTIRRRIEVIGDHLCRQKTLNSSSVARAPKRRRRRGNIRTRARAHLGRREQHLRRVQACEYINRIFR